MIKLKDILNEAVRYVDRSGKPFNIKGMKKKIVTIFCPKFFITNYWMSYNAEMFSNLMLSSREW